MENTLVLIKPDAVSRGLVGEITGRLERKGLQLVACRMTYATLELLREHYREHADKDYFPQIVSSMTAGPLVAQVWRGQDAVAVVRTLMGATDPRKATPGTIRGDLGLHVGRNLCHGSDGIVSADREIGLWFYNLCERTDSLYDLKYMD